MDAMEKKEQKVKIENRIISPFSWVENELIRGKYISFQALGLYLTLRSFGEISYPSVDYLCKLGKVGKEKLWNIMNELIQAKLLLRGQDRSETGRFTKNVYRIISLNDNYEEIYKEFMGEEYNNLQRLENNQSQAENPCTVEPHTEKPCTGKQPLIRIIKKEDLVFKEDLNKEINNMSGKPDDKVKDKKIKKEIYAKEEIETMKAVITSLNKIISKNYSYQTKETQKLLKPIIKIYSLKDIEAVIIMKGNEWYGGEFEKYLTPSTLFRFANFEKYYNSLPIELRGENVRKTV